MQFTIHTDGGARGNPGPAAIGVTIEQEEKTLAEVGEYIGHATNNVAEYRAVKTAYEILLKTVKAEDRGEVLFLLDSLLVVNQLTGKYKVKNTELSKIVIEIQALKREWGRGVSYRHIPRALNANADRLVNQALDREQELGTKD